VLGSAIEVSPGQFEFTDLAAANSPQRFYSLRWGPPAPAGMVQIPAGSFTMGSPTNEVGRVADEDPQTQVTFSWGFFLGRHEVTQGEYQSVMLSNPSYFTPTRRYSADTNRPVEWVSWNDATNYCARLTARELAAGRLLAGWAYRLPTEAEWEYASRAGSTNRFSYGDDPAYALLGNYAWYSTNSGGTTHTVGGKQPSPWGLYDMSGNVWEWCQDWYEAYPGGSVTNPQGSPSGSGRVVRGGSWDGVPLHYRSAFRNSVVPAGFNQSLGFRVVLAPTQP